MLHSEFGLMNIVSESVLDDKIPDATIVPITINYEKLLEEDPLASELLGEENENKSLIYLMKAAKILSKNFDKIHVNVCEPISLKYYLNKNHKNTDFNLMTVRKSIIENFSL